MRRSRAMHALWMAAIALLVSLRVLLQANMPIIGNPASIYDDMLMVQQANSLASGGWLGDYGDSTLAKYPLYPMFLAAANCMGVPVGMAIGICWSLACLLVFMAMREWGAPRPAAFAAFAAVLFSPVMLHRAMQRLYCLSMVPCVTLAVAAAYLALMATSPYGLRQWIYAALGAAATGAYAVLRQDAAWVVAMAAMMSALFVLRRFFGRSGGFGRRHALCTVVLAALPLVTPLSTSLALSVANWRHYSLMVRSDFTEGGFARACLALMSIRPEREMPRVYVSRDTIRKAYEASPTLRRIRRQLEQKLDDNPHGRTKTGEREREYYAWMLRWAARDAKIYSSAPRANAFFAAVASEIGTALSDGRLARRDALLLSPFTGPLTGRRFVAILRHSLAAGFRCAATFRAMRPSLEYVDMKGMHQSTAYNLDIMEMIASQRIPRSTWRGTRLWARKMAQHERAVGIAGALCAAYSLAGGIAAALAMAVFLVAAGVAARSLSRRHIPANATLVAFMAVLLCSAWGGLFVVSANFFEVTPSSSPPQYTCGAVALVQFFGCCALVLAWRLALDIRWRRVIAWRGGRQSERCAD